MLKLAIIMIMPSLHTTQSVFFQQPQATNRGVGALVSWGQTVFGRTYFNEPIGTNFVTQPTVYNQLPLSDTTYAPVIISTIAAGGAHNLISTTEGDVYSVGANFHGQLGLGDFFDRPQLSLITLFRNAPGAFYNGTTWVDSMGRQAAPARHPLPAAPARHPLPAADRAASRMIAAIRCEPTNTPRA